MAAALKRFYQGDDAKQNREMQIFRSCNDKIGKMLRWTNRDEHSIEELRELSLSQGGLYNASMRKRAWPALLGSHGETASTSPKQFGSHELDIIRKDVQRSAMFRSQAVTGSIVKGEQQSEGLQKKLVWVLNATFSGSGACYYQGLHEVAFVLLFNLGYDESATTAVLKKLMQTHLKDAARKDFSNVAFVLDSFLMPLIYTLDKEVYSAIVESDVPLTSSVLPWLISLFAHSVQDGGVASRLMDAFIAHEHPMLPFYVAVALLLHPTLRQQILASSYDTVMMHMAIQGLPGQLQNDFAEGEEGMVTAQDVIESALEIMRQHPPESLLRFLGGGLKKRARRRIQKKAQGISMLQIPVHTWKTSAEMLLRHHSVLPKELISRATIAYKAASQDCCTALAISKQFLLALQIVIFFILLPEQYVQKFYGLMHVITECLSPDWSLLESYKRKRNNKASSSVNGGNTTAVASKSAGLPLQLAIPMASADYEGGEIPVMVKSISTLSLSEMDLAISEV